MKMLGLVISLLCLALSLGHLVSELDNEWQLFKTRYNKKYDETGEMVRRVIWEDNLKYIWQHNLRADRGEHSFRLGMNQFGDMTREETVKQMNGYRMEKTNMGAKFLPPDHVIDLPATVDWRKKGYVTPVKNQGKCGSCWAFSSTGSLEGQHFRKSGTLMSLSEQNLIDCSRPEGNNGCEGGMMDYAFNYIKINHGIDTEQSYPYQAEDGRCRFKSADIGATDTGFMDIERGSESDLQQAAATVGPISVAIDASQRSFHFYESGVYDEPMCSSTRLDHGVLVVGYGDEEGQAYWLVKNSWGRGWGMEGYIMMSRNKDNQCGIATSASYPLV